MISSSNCNARAYTMDTGFDYSKMGSELVSDVTAGRNAVRKSKSVGNNDDTFRRLGILPIMPPDTIVPLENRTLYPKRNISGCDSNKIDSRTVKSDTACLSPMKPLRKDLFLKSGHDSSKQSPSSVLDLDKLSSSIHRSISEKISLSHHGNCITQQLSGTEINQPTFHLSSQFSDDEETINEASSFAGDDIASLPTTVRLSISNISTPSELTASHETLTLSGSSPSKRADRRNLLKFHSTSRSTEDFIPLPPRRKNSNRETLKNGNNLLIPQQIQCFPMDESPMKPARQMSSKKLFDGNSSSSIVTSLSIDLSPKKPKRQNSDKYTNSDSFSIALCCVSVDSSPQKPERQKSNNSLNNSLQKLNHSMIDAGAGHQILSTGMSRGRIQRSESKLQTRLPTLTRRTSIREGETNALPYMPHASITNDSNQGV